MIPKNYAFPNSDSKSIYAKLEKANLKNYFYDPNVISARNLRFSPKSLLRSLDPAESHSCHDKDLDQDSSYRPTVYESPLSGFIVSPTELGTTPATTSLRSLKSGQSAFDFHFRKFVKEVNFTTNEIINTFLSNRSININELLLANFNQGTIFPNVVPTFPTSWVSEIPGNKEQRENYLDYNYKDHYENSYYENINNLGGSPPIKTTTTEDPLTTSPLFPNLVEVKPTNETESTAIESSGIGFSINVSCHWAELATPILVCLAICFVSFTKYLAHLVEKIHFPESCFLTILGIVIGILTNYFLVGYDSVTISFSSHAFFVYILPPIVFESGYFMPKLQFFENFGTILLFSVPGTLANALGVGLILNFLDPLAGIEIGGKDSQPLPQIFDAKNLSTTATRSGMIGPELAEVLPPVSLSQYLLFGTILSAVDPVAVVNTFSELNVNFVLYIIVFGESLLNDGVAVALFKIFSSPNINNMSIASVLLQFLYVSLGGVLIGYVFALIISYLSRFTSSNIRLFEPFLLICMSYICYLVAELFGTSAILAVVMCGFSMREYVEHNIHPESQDTFKYTIKSIFGVGQQQKKETKRNENTIL